MPVIPPGLLTIGRQRYYTPAPNEQDEYYRGSMPEYVAPNQDRLATQPNDQMLYSDAKREGIPIERINAEDQFPPNFHILKSRRGR